MSWEKFVYGFAMYWVGWFIAAFLNPFNVDAGKAMKLKDGYYPVVVAICESKEAVVKKGDERLFIKIPDACASTCNPQSNMIHKDGDGCDWLTTK